MKVKFCGITRLEDAEEAAELGAWAIGLVHYRRSPRSVRYSDAAVIGAAMKRRCEVVGVFVNPTLDRVVDAAGNGSLSMIQLSGEEGPAFCTEVARRTGCPVIKAIHVSSAADLQRAEPFRTAWHLFDSRVGNRRGGTGEVFDWGLLAGHHTGVPFILAGGLDPENVGTAIGVVHPGAVDVASGVESEPGVKDHVLMARFIEAAQSATAVAE
ncbi:MAG: phosphoribosylanthranilate isomerase [Solirubrobacterales bacterium]|jgi:phosphoribosylanthranilate isomerase